LRGRRLFRGEDGALDGARLGGGRELGELLLRASMGRAPPSEGHGAGRRAGRAAGGSVLPSSMRGSSTPCHRRPGTPPVWRPGPPRLRRPRLPTFRIPAKGSGRRAARVLGSLRKYVNERGIAPTARPPDLRSRGPREWALQSTDQRLFDHRYTPQPDGRSVPFVARPVSARELLVEPWPSREP
jgi:hypothetical protein